MTVRMLIRTIGIALAVCLTAFAPQEAQAQCGVAYFDSWMSSGSLYSDVGVEDYFGSGCDPGYWGGGGGGGSWYHDYGVSVEIFCPGGISDYQDDSSTEWGGGGSAFASVVVIPINPGVCTIEFYTFIWCSALVATVFEEGGSQQVPMASLKVNQNTCPTTVTVTRGDLITATLDAGGETISNQQWTFNGGGGSASKSGGNSWGGEMAASGTITVTFKIEPNFEGLEKSCTVTVNDRQWSTPPADAERNTGGWHPAWPSPVGFDDPFGLSVPRILPPATLNAREISDSGPNHLFKYFDQPIPFATWEFYWDRHSELEFPFGPFYQAQCGDYPANPNGYTDGENLRLAVEGHEHAHFIFSHHANYKAALSGNNFDAALDAAFAPNTTAKSVFESDMMNQILNDMNPNSVMSNFISTYAALGEPNMYIPWYDPQDPLYIGKVNVDSGGGYASC